jgi:hypothetical protein
MTSSSHGSSRARSAVEQGDLADHLAGAHDAERRVAALGACAQDLQPAFDDHVQLSARVGLLHDDLARGAALALCQRGDRGELVRPETAEQRRLAQ